MSGANAFTRMPCAASSSAAVFVRLITPAFAAAYAANPGAARTPSIDVTLMMLPPRPAATIVRATRCVHSRTWPRLLRSSVSQPFSDVSSSGEVNTPPALFTRTSTAPRSASVRSSAAPT
jgi:hypothetical protein